MRSIRVAMLAGVVALLSACGLEAPLPDVCRDLKNQSFPASPGGVGTQTVNRLVEENFDLSSAGDLSELSPKVRLKSMTLTALSGISDFGFVDAVSVDIQDAVGGSLPTTNVTTYARDTAAAASATLEMKGADADLWPYVKDSKVKFNATFTGEPPTSSWTAGVKVCLGLSASLLGGAK
jgi:hypothetical protein